jgi:hypothetical protein
MRGDQFTVRKFNAGDNGNQLGILKGNGLFFSLANMARIVLKVDKNAFEWTISAS